MELIVDILEYTSLEFPFWVSCRLCDIYGKEWFFVEKLPVVSYESKIEDFPAKGYIRGKIISRENDIVLFCTKLPDYVESKDGNNKFYVSINQLIDNKHLNS